MRINENKYLISLLFIIIGAITLFILNPALLINPSEMICDDGYKLRHSTFKMNNTTWVSMTTPKYMTCLKQDMDITLTIFAPNGTIMNHGNMYDFVGTIPPYYGEGTRHHLTYSNLTWHKPYFEK